MPETLNKIYQTMLPYAKSIAIVLVGFIIVMYIKRIARRVLKKSSLDQSLINFLVKVLGVLLNTLIILSALSDLGVSTGGLVAAISAAVVAIGVALKDSLSNVAGGILLLISPRFVTGDFIEVEEDSGTVTRIDLLHTTIKTPDNRQISIPNGVLINSHITNYSGEETRRVEILVPIPYEADAELAKTILLTEISKHPKVLTQPDTPLVRVKNYGPSAVEIVTRAWCKKEDYWDLYFDLVEGYRAALDAKGIQIPYNQLDVRIVK